MLGQDQDSYGGGLDSAQSFQGFLSNLNVWDYVVCQEIIKRMSKACLAGEGNVYKWSNFKHAFQGETRLFIPSPCVPPTAQPSMYTCYVIYNIRISAHSLQGEDQEYHNPPERSPNPQQCYLQSFC